MSSAKADERWDLWTQREINKSQPKIGVSLTTDSFTTNRAMPDNVRPHAHYRVFCRLFQLPSSPSGRRLMSRWNLDSTKRFVLDILVGIISNWLRICAHIISLIILIFGLKPKVVHVTAVGKYLCLVRLLQLQHCESGSSTLDRVGKVQRARLTVPLQS